MERRIYMAPLEGITTYWYRQVHHMFFQDIDKYFTPFIAPHTKRNLNTRELKEILPENNAGMCVVPQILTNVAQDFIRVAEHLTEFGYDEVNLNLGCPSGTVTSKGKGAGFLAYPDKLQAFLEEIYDKLPQLNISIKTRIGMDEPEEFDRLLKIYNQYPIHELIIHPRVQSDFYKKHVHMEAFQMAMEQSKNPIVYNGDIFHKEDANQIWQQFPELQTIMLGRGLIANPFLASMINGQNNIDKQIVKEFHDRLYQGYQEQQSGDANVLYKMKEIWAYMGKIFTNYDAYGKKINKCNKCYAYDVIVQSLFREQEICENAKFIGW